MKIRVGKCESCELVRPYERGLGAWRYRCSVDGKGRRGGDTCPGYREDKERIRMAKNVVQTIDSDRGCSVPDYF